MTATKSDVLTAAPAATSGPAAPSRLVSFITKAPPWTGVGVLIALIVVFMGVTDDFFLTYNNINNILRGGAVPLLLAAGTTFVITTGMIDLSLASLLALSSMTMLGFMNLGLPSILCVLLTIVVGALLGGVVNGALIAKAGLFFMVVTLGSSAIFRAAAQIPTEGKSITLYNREGFDTIAWLGDGKVGGVSVPVVVAFAVVVLSALVMKYTNFGRSVNAVGGNEAAARLAGIPVDRVRIAVFAINGALVALAGVLMSGRLSSASPSFGTGMELNVIAAVLLGGSSFMGGSSTFMGTTIGIMFTQVLQNALTLKNVNSFWQGIVTGVVLIAAVAIDRLRAKKA
ncbi:MAG: ABC transporter permease [Actinobacteria bacterium]|nr:ABC transporter permease [Actinomycetota bacterium]